MDNLAESSKWTHDDIMVYVRRFYGGNESFYQYLDKRLKSMGGKLVNVNIHQIFCDWTEEIDDND